MQKILFVRKFKKPSGGQVKVRDYFAHCLYHPDLRPYLYFTPDSNWQTSPFWDLVPKDRLVREVEPAHYDLLFLAGRDWEYVPEIPSSCRVINYIQHVKHAEANDKRHEFLRRPAWRICVSEEVAAAIRPFVVGGVSVIQNGIPLELFHSETPKSKNSILILARKNPELGARLFAARKGQNRNVDLLVDYIPREDFARHLRESDIFVALPHETEGFYLPALEAMASGCAVICSDAVGNRSFCRHNDTCLTPKYNDYEDHLRLIEQLLSNFALKEKIRRRGRAMAPTFSLETERKTFYALLEKISIQP
jgi:hypothetical protein